MNDSGDHSVEWVERDRRRWLELAPMPDQLTARMFVTMLEANGLEGRVGSVSGRFVIEVPEDQHEAALALVHPEDSGIAPPLEEARHKTGIHTGSRIRKELATRAMPRRRIGRAVRGLAAALVALVACGLAVWFWLF